MAVLLAAGHLQSLGCDSACPWSLFSRPFLCQLLFPSFLSCSLSPSFHFGPHILPHPARRRYIHRLCFGQLVGESLSVVVAVLGYLPPEGAVPSVLVALLAVWPLHGLAALRFSALPLAAFSIPVAFSAPRGIATRPPFAHLRHFFVVVRRGGFARRDYCAVVRELAVLLLRAADPPYVAGVGCCYRGPLALRAVARSLARGGLLLLLSQWCLASQP